MRVGYFCLQSRWSTHRAHDLELIQTDLDAGHDVHVVRPSRTLRFSDTKPFSSSRRHLAKELLCFWSGMNLLSDMPTVHTVGSLVRGHPLDAELRDLRSPEFDSHDALDEYRFHGHDAGNAVLSSLISNTRDTGVDVGRHRDFVVRAVDTSIKVYIAARSFIERMKPDRVVLFNGRMATFRGVLRACQETGMPCWVHDRGATLDRVCIAENTMPHDTGWVADQIVKSWEFGPESDDEKRAIGRSFFERKRNRDGFAWVPFTTSQERGRLPDGVREDRPILTIFTSSEYERFQLPQYFRYYVHLNQLEGILDVVEILAGHGFDGDLCIRLHPNSKGERPDLGHELACRIRHDFVRIVPPDSDVDTYALLDASDKVITFGSSMAMEAAYWGKPSVSFATNTYQRLDSTYTPSDRDTAVRLVVDPLPPKDTDDTLRFGYYYSTFGRVLRYAKPIDVHRFRFKGVDAHQRFDAPLVWLGKKMRHRWRRPSPRPGSVVS